MDLGMFFCVKFEHVGGLTLLTGAVFIHWKLLNTQQTYLLIEIRAGKFGVLVMLFAFVGEDRFVRFETLSKLSSFIYQISAFRTPALSYALSLSIDLFLHYFSSIERKKGGQKKSCRSFFLPLPRKKDDPRYLFTLRVSPCFHLRFPLVDSNPVSKIRDYRRMFKKFCNS